MKHSRLYLTSFLLLFFFSFFSPCITADTTDHGQINDTVLAMCRPTVRQIKNIQVLYEKNLITLDHMRLICIYHEDELTDYQPAYEYVNTNKLTWISFHPIKHHVPVTDLFKKNKWSKQFEEIFYSTDGIIFTGGSDIPPTIYGEENNLLTVADTPTRTMYELSFLFHLVGGSRNPEFVPLLEKRQNYPILAICLGAQTLNVAAGGTLYQDIPSQVYNLETVEQVLSLETDQVHSSTYTRALHPTVKDLAPAFHQIKLKKNSIFVQEMKMRKKDTPLVLTSHHQAIKKLGKDLYVTGTSMDKKIIEAVEHKKYKNVLGVQFHPEPYSLYMKGLLLIEKPDSKKVFNLRSYLKSHPPAMEFHQKIWAWFSSALTRKTK